MGRKITIVRCPGCGERRDKRHVTWLLNPERYPVGLPRICGGCVRTAETAWTPLGVEGFLAKLREERAAELAFKRTEVARWKEATFDYTWCGTAFKLRRRDSQRARAYEAEDRAFEKLPLLVGGDLASATTFIERILASPIWAQVSKEQGTNRTRLDVHLTRERGGAYQRMNEIGLSRRACCRPWVLLHELAHASCHYRVHHHWPWANAYLQLVDAELGRECRMRLQHEFERNGVQYEPKPEDQAAGCD